MKDKDLDWAVFWASLLQPVVLGEVPPEEIGKFLRELAREERLFPDGRRRTFFFSTPSFSRVAPASLRWR